MKQRLELHFAGAGERLRLTQTVLEGPGLSGGKVSKVAFSAADVPPSGDVIRWGRGMQALCLALLIHRSRAGSNPEGMLSPLLEGPRGSAASTLASLCYKADSLRWLEDVFKLHRSDFVRRRLDGWFERRNPEANNLNEPVRVYARRGPGALAPEDVEVFVNGRVARAGELEGLIAELSHRFAAGSAGVAVGVSEKTSRKTTGFLPATSPDLFGRSAELAEISAAFLSPGCRLLQIVGPGGMGKTALAAHWLENAIRGGSLPFDRIFKWSFYRQGFAADAMQSFWPFREALADVLDAEILPIAAPREMVNALAEAFESRATLLVLDGMEAVMHPPGERAGLMRDDILPELLSRIAHARRGFCLLTTRIAAPELANLPNVRTLSLKALARSHSRLLLSHLGVHGAPLEMEAAATFAGGSPLLLRLLANLFVNAREGFNSLGVVISALQKRRPAESGQDPRDESLHRILSSYAERLHGSPELTLLQLATLFDRVPEHTAMEALLGDEQKLAGWLERWDPLQRERWLEAAAHLRSVQLASAGEGLALEIHPCVHRWFAQKFATEEPAAWRAGQLALYQYFRAVPEKELPDTSEEMEPLLRACHHGARADAHLRAWNEIAFPRLFRGLEGYILAQLGAGAETLALLGCFCGADWKFPRSIQLPNEVKGTVLTMLSHVLRVQERHEEATEVGHRAMRYLRMDSDPAMFFLTVVNLLRLYQYSGQLRKGLSVCRHLRDTLGSETDPSDPKLLTVAQPELAQFLAAVVAEFFLACGMRTVAENLVRQATARAEGSLPSGMAAAYHGAFLIETGRTSEVLRAIELGQTESYARRYEFMNSSWLLKGRAWMQHAIETAGERDAELVTRAGMALEAAVHQARSFGRWVLVAEALLARSCWQSRFGTEEAFQAGSTETLEISRRFNLRLIEADLRILQCDHFVRRRQMGRACCAWREAAQLVQRTHYGLRREEIERLRRICQK